MKYALSCPYFHITPERSHSPSVARRERAVGD